MKYAPTAKALMLGLAVFMADMAPAPAHARNKVVRQVEVTGAFKETGLTWLGRPQPGYVLKWKSKVFDGVIHVCGAVAYGDIQMRSQSASVLRKAFIVYEGKKVMRNMTYFKRAKSIRRLSGATANCASTGIKVPRGAYDLWLGWDAGSVPG